jgi:hypothetical protein
MIGTPDLSSRVHLSAEEQQVDMRDFLPEQRDVPVGSR